MSAPSGQSGLPRPFTRPPAGRRAGPSPGRFNLRAATPPQAAPDGLAVRLQRSRAARVRPCSSSPHGRTRRRPWPLPCAACPPLRESTPPSNHAPPTTCPPGRTRLGLGLGSNSRSRARRFPEEGRRRIGRSRVRCVKAGFVHKTQMSHLRGRRRRPERAPGGGAENAGGISVAPCSRSITAVSRGIPGSQARNTGAGRQRLEKWTVDPGAQLSDFPRAIAGARPNRGPAGAPERRFPAIFGFSEGISDFPTNFRRVSEDGRRDKWDIKCLIMRHGKWLRKRIFRAWGGEEAILGFV